MAAVSNLLKALLQYFQKRKNARGKTRKKKRASRRVFLRGKKPGLRNKKRLPTAKIARKKKPVKRPLTKHFSARKKKVSVADKRTKRHIGARRSGPRKIKPVKSQRSADVRRRAQSSVPLKEAVRPQKTRPAERKNGSRELCIGRITHYFSRIEVAVLPLTHGNLKVGDLIHVKSISTDFIQKVKSLQIESLDVKTAQKGQIVGLKVDQKAREGDQVLKLL